VDRRERLTLERVEQGLPTHYYYDPAHYQRELEAIWYDQWVYLCRSEDLAESREFKVSTIGDESIVLTRNLSGELRAFYNTCRHRGSVLCTEAKGRFKGKSIVCPYHRWAYSLDGELVNTPYRLPTDDFRMQDYSLYEVAVGEWGGFVFVHLTPGNAPDFHQVLGDAAQLLANWKIQDLRVGHRSSATVECNWKVFCENFGECLHCPDLHPELSELVPIYKKGLVSERELPDYEPPARPDPRGETPLRDGAVTWTLDGQSKLPRLEGLSADEQARGQTFATVEPNFFLIAHVDYVRAIRLMPLGPERCELSMEWLFHPSALESEDFDLEHATALAKTVSAQDRRACELNQRGLRSRAHSHGILVRQEYWVYRFQSWVRECLSKSGSRADPAAGGSPPG
jgi:Rieske 2Fe-2S family protein